VATSTTARALGLSSSCGFPVPQLVFLPVASFPERPYPVAAIIEPASSGHRAGRATRPVNSCRTWLRRRMAEVDRRKTVVRE
jgi:hypothetical protein